jgi:hypothetical protein
MSEIFRFAVVRGVQLADPATAAIDLTAFIGAGVRPEPLPVSSLHYAAIYQGLSASLTAPGFDPTTTSATVRDAVAKNGGLARFVVNKSYAVDKNNAAVALIDAHRVPASDASTETLATCIRIMNLMDATAAGQPVDTAAALTSYLSRVIIAPPGTFNPRGAPPPYNPYVVPAGVADLYVVRQELKGYELKEISYVANVLKSESAKRVTVRFQKTDETYTTTTDTTTQTEQDTESAQRFQLQTQAQSIINSDSSLNFGLTVSASYGPTVQANSNFSAASNNAKSQSQSVAGTYANDVTTRTVARVTQQVTQQHRLDVINSFRERVEHGFDNTSGTGNVSGVYQYVDALYEVGVFNYGKRLLFDLIVPDPAALIRQAINAANTHAVTAYDPPPIDFSPGDLTVPVALYKAAVPDKTTWGPVPPQWPANVLDPADAKSDGIDYTIPAQTYQAGSIAPPPAPFVVVSWGTAAAATPNGGALAPASDHITIPDGYRAATAIVQAAMAMQYDSPYILTVQLGASPQQRIGNESNPDPPPGRDVAENQPISIPLSGETGEVAVTVGTGNLAQYTLNVEVLCQLTEEAFAKWQLDTYSLITQSYLSLLSTYQQAASAGQQSLGGMSYAGGSPDENQRIIQGELARAFISMLTLQQFDPPAAAYASGTTYKAGDTVSYSDKGYQSLAGGNTGNQPDTSPTWWAKTADYPSLTYPPAMLPDTAGELNFTSAFAQAPYIRFLQEALEWTQTQYVFYPYYWDQKADWPARVLTEDSDPLFAQFLRSGAARVVVPVRPGFCEALVYFLQKGQPWDGGAAPSIVDSLYVSIAAEIAQSDQQPTAETLVPPTWTMRLPTTLVKLRNDPHPAPAYNAATIYPLGAVVTFARVRYSSLRADNTGHQPDSSPEWWAPADPALPSWTLDSDFNVIASN